MSASMVVTNELTKRYGRFTALEHCQLQVERGEVFGLLGPNGSGKTTLLRLLMGFLRPSAGTAQIDGLDCYRDSVAVHARAAYLPGEARLPARLRGREVLRFFADVRSGGSYQRACRIAERLRLDTGRQVALMSTGMRQKLALAAILSAETPLVILDEPTSNLDPSMRSEVVSLVREAQQAGRTVLFSSHVLSEVEQACDRVVILRRGHLVHTQIVGQLLRQHRIRARLTGAMAPPPASLTGRVAVEQHAGGEVTIETPGELSPLLGWLAELPLAEVQIEPVGLQAVYDRYHASDSA
jgi:ABC-2 type transport system ATP-binding protein